MATYKELLAQKVEIEKAIAIARDSEVIDAVAQCKSLIMEFDLTEEDLFATARAKNKLKSPKQKTAAHAKYRDQQTGKEWSGRGRQPNWIAGKDLKAFEIAK